MMRQFVFEATPEALHGVLSWQLPLRDIDAYLIKSRRLDFKFLREHFILQPISWKSTLD